jgi:hypothetical protein
LICGWNFGGYYNDVQEYDSIKGTLTEVSTIGEKPQPRRGPCSTIIGDIIYVYGGYTGGGYCNDIF